MNDEASETEPRVDVFAMPHLKDFRKLLEELRKESPRGQVLISVAMLDDQLKRCIEARLVEHRAVAKLTEGFNAPFGTLSARIVGALALGIISEAEYSDLHNLRQVRNAFAHRMLASFDDNDIRDRCLNLTFAAPDYDDVVVGPQGKFIAAVTALILHLVNRPHYVAQKRLTHEPWPY